MMNKNPTAFSAVGGVKQRKQFPKGTVSFQCWRALGTNYSNTSEVTLVQLAYLGTRSDLHDLLKFSPAMFLYVSVLLNDVNSLNHKT